MKVSSILIAILLLAGWKTVAQERVYNEKKTFSFVPAEGWEDQTEGGAIIFSQPKTGSRDKYRENIWLGHFPANGEGLEDLWKSFIIRDFTRIFDDFEIIHEGLTELHGQSAIWMLSESSAFDRKFKDLVYMTMRRGMVYYIVCIAEKKEFDDVEMVFKGMVDSFRIE